MKKPLITIASGNPKKVAEIEAMLGPLPIEIQRQPNSLDVEETGKTYFDNALLKAKAAAQLTGSWTIADDSGLEIDSLGNSPGIFSARLAKTNKEKIDKILTALGDSPYRSAKVCSVMVLCNKKGELIKLIIANKKRILVKENMKWSEVAKISSNITELDGVYIEMVLVRKYFSRASSHLIGYVGKPDKEKNSKLYRIEGTKVGKLAAEAAFDNTLQGKFGLKKEEVNAHGRVVNEISRIKGTPGNDINLSVSRELQDFCYERLGEEAGSIVILDINSGELLSLVSKPSFNSNDFIGEMNNKKWKKIVNNQSQIISNKSVIV